MTGPLWVNVAGLVRGVKEIPGPASNPLILQWAKEIGAPAWYDNDDKAWCAIIVNRVHLACDLPLAGEGYDLLRAKSFLLWGQKLDTPLYGCVMVFTREGGGHVGWLVGESQNFYLIRGGNQDNKVSDAWIRKDRLDHARWPSGVPQTAGPIPLYPDPSGPGSVNEA